jgi:hypothetical protein
MIVERFKDQLITLDAFNRVIKNDAAVHFRVNVNSRNCHKTKSLVVNFGEFIGDDFAQSFAQPCGSRKAPTSVGSRWF